MSDNRLQRLLALPPGARYRKLRDAGVRRARDVRARLRNTLRTTYGPAVWRLEPLLTELPPDLVPDADRDTLAGISAQYLDHRFDYLGMGWPVVRHGLSAPGFDGNRYAPGPAVHPDPQGSWLAGRVNRANLGQAMRRWRLIEGPYEPIDWHVDAKSGYRWPSRKHAMDTGIGHAPGADVKLPWEVARLHHLPQLALAYLTALNGHQAFEPAEAYQRAFRNQVLDFLAQNPPAFGPNWHTGMLAAIRGANLVFGWALFSAAGARFDAPFERILAGAAHDHAEFVVRNLDWFDLDERNNHYLSNLAGLLVMTAHVDDDPEANAWFDFASSELDREIAHQFSPDGSHFEESTCYHAFSVDMVAWAAAVRQARQRIRARAKGSPSALPRAVRARTASAARPDASTVLDRLRGAHRFLKDVTLPSGRLVQIGDNDSGRFIRLLPPAVPITLDLARIRYAHLDQVDPDAAPRVWWDEDQLNYRATREVLGVLVGRCTLPQSAEARLVRQLVSYGPSPAPEADRAAPPASAAQEMPVAPVAAWTQALGGATTGAPWRLAAYPDFGLYLFRAGAAFVSVRCGPAVRRTGGGHDHFDQLAVVVVSDILEAAVDPGAFVYTPAPTLRARYRGPDAHFIPRVLERSHDAGVNAVFSPVNSERAVCVQVDDRSFLGQIETIGGSIYRRVLLEADSVQVLDGCDPAVGSMVAPAETVAQHRALLPSAGYGKLRRM